MFQRILLEGIKLAAGHKCLKLQGMVQGGDIQMVVATLCIQEEVEGIPWWRSG